MLDPCHEYLGPFRCELELGHRGPCRFDSRRKMDNDFQDALMFLRMFISRKNMVGMECLKPKVLEWMKRKGYEPSILREKENPNER